ncbi:thiamine pyrophosphate-dependent enzyme [Candidatus Palauibacter soopunensis]|uniref:thiamine pyrophosphate-dependent enzyme n=1 Tax=Candidatus Palauibacter soopunensis TaxID=3056739 RepID=UPI00239CFA2C|nr:thiamine pyrophosphate-dependent enzyme [Candidatus Palauibacter soopunensis]MDE2877670.1 thiamine pyrophosphate-dependent enzyme [Candidatus Palauibacter soopunensis]
MRDAGLDRRALVAGILDRRGDAAVVAGLGSPAWDCHAAGDSPLNFYFWGAMGGAAMLGLGVALARPTRRVLVVTGDAEMLMGVGSLAAIAAQAPPNLALLVLDNEAFGETGRQAGLTAKNTDIAAIARGAGIEAAFTVGGESGEGSAGPDVEGSAGVDVAALAATLFEEEGPVLCVAKVALSAESGSYPPRDGVLLQTRFRAALAGD